MAKDMQRYTDEAINATMSVTDSLFRSQGPADKIYDESTSEIIDKDSYDRDRLGFTNPNLHRRIDPQAPTEELKEQGELRPREYTVGIYGTDSYRTTHKVVHIEDPDENFTQEEIP